MDSIELETIKIRLQGIHNAITRSRFTFLISTIVSVAIFVTAWNAYLSWNSNFVKQSHWSHDSSFNAEERARRLKELQDENTITLDAAKKAEIKSEAMPTPTIDPKQLTEVTNFAQQELSTEWIKNRTITIGLLGIRVSVDDLPILGGLSLWIISIWFFYCVRRENRAIGTLLRDAYRLKDWQLRYMVYQGIVHHLVLLDLGRGNRPIYDFKQEESGDPQDMPILRGSLRLLFYLPTLSILFVVLMDVLTLVYFSAPFRPSHGQLRHLLTWDDWVKVAVMESLALMFVLFTTTLSVMSSRHTQATEILLKEYRRELKRSMGERRVSD